MSDCEADSSSSKLNTDDKRFSQPREISYCVNKFHHRSIAYGIRQTRLAADQTKNKTKKCYSIDVTDHKHNFTKNAVVKFKS